MTREKANEWIENTFSDFTKEELDKIISECEEKGYLIVGKENLL